MKMYDFTLAPSPRRVRIFLAEKGISVELVQVDIMRNANRTPEFYRKNPLGSLPILELDDGSCLSESVAICRYFEEIQPAPQLFGVGARDQAIVEMWNRRIETRNLRAGGTSMVASEQSRGRTWASNSGVRRNSKARGARSHRMARFGAQESRIHRG